VAVSSKLATDARGRRIVVISSPTEPHLEPGRIFYIIGNDMPVNEPGFRMLGSKTSHRTSALDVVQHGARLRGRSPLASPVERCSC
jgi:hypothetical protein